MDLGIISMRYAKALLKFAAEHKEEECVYAEMGNVTAAFAKVEALQHALLNPVLTDAQREQLLATAAGSEKDLTATTRRFIHLVVTKGRADMMQLIARSYGTLYRRERHIVEGSLTVPVSLTPELTERLRSIVEKRTDCRVDFSVKEDKELLGGFVLQYDTYRLDASVKTQLQKMKRELAG